MSVIYDPEKRDRALREANERRLEVAEWRKRLRRNVPEIRRALATKPDPIAEVLVVELLSWARARGLRAGQLEEIGRQAVVDDVNLLVPLGRASVKTRAWAIEHGLKGVHRVHSNAGRKLREVA